jgi:hypothetical protein
MPIGAKLLPSSTIILLICATLIGIVSFLFHLVVHSRLLSVEVITGYVPVCLGCCSMWLCAEAWCVLSTKLSLFLTSSGSGLFFLEIQRG